jgi:hypothetical protein
LPQYPVHFFVVEGQSEGQVAFVSPLLHTPSPHFAPPLQ